MHLSLQIKAIVCHLAALLWIPIACLAVLGVGQTKLGQIMFLGSLSMAADGEHSANFVGMAWLVTIVILSMILVLWIPLAIALVHFRLPDRLPDALLQRSSLNVVNWLLSCILLLIFSLVIVEWLDRLIPPPESPPWITWSLAALVLELALHQLIMAIWACHSVLKGQSKRYFFALPILR